MEKMFLERLVSNTVLHNKESLLFGRNDLYSPRHAQFPLVMVFFSLKIVRVGLQKERVGLQKETMGMVTLIVLVMNCYFFASFFFNIKDPVQ